MRFLILAAFLAGSVFAQISDLATTDNGENVLFVTNRLRQAGTDQEGQYQLFRLSAGNLTLVNGDQLDLKAPSISGDGTAVVTNWTYTPPRTCQPVFQPCGVFEFPFGEPRYRLDYAGGVESGDGIATLTPNGRYLSVLRVVPPPMRVQPRSGLPSAWSRWQAGAWWSAGIRPSAVCLPLTGWRPTTEACWWGPAASCNWCAQAAPSISR